MFAIQAWDQTQLTAILIANMFEFLGLQGAGLELPRQAVDEAELGGIALHELCGEAASAQPEPCGLEPVRSPLFASKQVSDEGHKVVRGVSPIIHPRAEEQKELHGLVFRGLLAALGTEEHRHMRSLAWHHGPVVFERLGTLACAERDPLFARARLPNVIIDARQELGLKACQRTFSLPVSVNRASWRGRRCCSLSLIQGWVAFLNSKCIANS